MILRTVSAALAAVVMSLCVFALAAGVSVADDIHVKNSQQAGVSGSSNSIADVIEATIAATRSESASSMPTIPKEGSEDASFTPVPPEPNTPYDTKPIYSETTENNFPAAEGGPGKAGHFYGLSYSPFSLGDNRLCPPFDDTGGFCLLPNQVEKDMEGLSKLTRRIKTYSSVCGLATKQIFESARKLNMTVVMGVWITPNTTANSLEFNRMMPFVKHYHDIITLMMVGNEAVFVLKTPPKVVAGAIEEVRRRLVEVGVTKIPIGTADIFNVWMSTPVGGKDKIAFDVEANDMAPVVEVSDYLGLNAHAYWAGIDPSKRNSGSQVLDGQREVQLKWKKPVYVMETGFPTKGEPRTTNDGTASPGLKELSLFAYDIEVEARKRKVPVFYFEPYNGDWKRRWEPYVEMDYSFGLAYCNRTMKDISLPPLGAL